MKGGQYRNRTGNRAGRLELASNSAIRQIATSYEGSVFAAADAERAVHIFTLDQPAEVTGFETIFEFGGQRLAISPGGTFCVTGAYNRDGVALYETNGGSLIWHRKDLRGVQRLQFSRHEDAVLASLEGGPLLLLDSRTGATLRDLPGVMDIEESPFGRAKLVCNSARYVFRDENREIDLEVKPLGHFCRAAFTETSVIVEVVQAAARPLGWRGPREQRFGLACCSITDGRVIWQRMLRPGVNAQRLAFAEDENEVVAVVWPFVRGGNKKMIYLDPVTGDLRREVGLNGAPYDTVFARRGRILVTSNGEIISVGDGRLVRSIELPEVRDPEDRGIP